MLIKKNAASILYSIIYFGCILLASRMLVIHSGAIFGWVGSLLGLDTEVVSYGKDILMQLRSASVTSPWLVLLAVCALSCFICVRVSGTRMRPVVIILGIILFLPLVLAAVLLTEVNSILTGKLVFHLLSLL